jgi:hypothetical protein
MWLGLRGGAGAVGTATLTVLAAWISDVLDGSLARRDRRGLRTWIGNHDLEADLTVGLGTWVYLTLAGFISFWPAVAYGVAGGAVLWRFTSEPLAWGLQALPYGAMVWTACRVVPLYGLLLVIYVVVVLVATRSRVLGQMQAFIDTMRDLGGSSGEY